MKKKTEIKYAINVASLFYPLRQANETDTMLMEHWRGIVNEPPCPQSDIDGIVTMAKALCREPSILVLETPNVMARAMADQDGCRVESVTGRHAVAYASLLTSKGSPYTSEINNMLSYTAVRDRFSPPPPDKRHSRTCWGERCFILRPTQRPRDWRRREKNRFQKFVSNIWYRYLNLHSQNIQNRLVDTERDGTKR